MSDYFSVGPIEKNDYQEASYQTDLNDNLSNNKVPNDSLVFKESAENTDEQSMTNVVVGKKREMEKKSFSKMENPKSKKNQPNFRNKKSARYKEEEAEFSEGISERSAEKNFSNEEPRKIKKLDPVEIAIQSTSVNVDPDSFLQLSPSWVESAEKIIASNTNQGHKDALLKIVEILKEIKRKYDEAKQQNNSKDTVFTMLISKGHYIDVDQILADYIKEKDDELRKIFSKALDHYIKIKFWFIKMPNSKSFSKLQKIGKQKLKPDNIRKSFLDLLIKFIRQVLDGKNTFDKLLSKIDANFSKEIADLFEYLKKEENIEGLKKLKTDKKSDKKEDAAFKKAKVLELENLLVRWKNFEVYWKKFVDLVLVNDVKILQDWLSLFCVRSNEGESWPERAKSCLQDYLKNDMTLKKLLSEAQKEKLV